ncbi:MAG: TIGR00725 family protein [Balneolaceae bacterium]|nr:TIGR00725 family protein [Balneolaceae bacterium]
MANIIIGVMGPGGGAGDSDLEIAYELGKLIADEGWTLLTGGRRAGVMDAASRGAKESGGLTVGILPGHDRAGVSPHVDVPVVTGVGSARNNINVLSCDLVFACGVGMGTFSEVLLAVKAGKQVILLNQTEASINFLEQFASDRIHFVSAPSEAIELAARLLD